MNIGIFVSLLLVLPPVCGQKSNLSFSEYIRYLRYKTWTDARSFCRENHIDLVTIKSEEENLLSGTVGYWIGLYRRDENSLWKWASDETTMTFSNWRSGEPRSGEHCGMKVHGEWLSERCEVLHSFTCFDERLILVKENKTWEEALDHCRSLRGESSVNLPTSKSNPDLVTLITKDDHDYARERAQEATTNEVWTGLRFIGNAWYWIGGEAVQYQDLSSCPASRCGVLEKNTDTLFGTRDCSRKLNFFCYNKPQN